RLSCILKYRSGLRLPEVIEEQAAVVPSSLDIASHRGCDIAPRKIFGSPQDQAVGCLAVSAAPAGLLVVGFERGRWTPMEHPTDIGFVDPHTERTRCDDDVYLVGEKAPEHASSNAGAQACRVCRGANARPEE